MPEHPRPGSAATSDRDLRPFCWALAVAVWGTATLMLAIAHEWLGPEVGRGSEFCEEFRSGCLKQPANTLTNLGFVVAGLAAGWRARVPANRGVGLLSRTGVVTAMACVIVLLGPASAAMHATGTAMGGHLDLLSMYLVAGFAAAYSIARTAGSQPVFWLLLVLFVVGSQAIGALAVDVPVLHRPGNVAFAGLLLLVVVWEGRLWRRGAATRLRLGWGLAAVATLLVAFGIWALSQGPWCDPDSWVQGHGVWHLLCALSAYLLFRLYASEHPDPSTAGDRR